MAKRCFELLFWNNEYHTSSTVIDAASDGGELGWTHFEDAKRILWLVEINHLMMLILLPRLRYFYSLLYLKFNSEPIIPLEKATFCIGLSFLI